ncbi:hypothetical protein ACJDU8_12025 [Clostridium sp. WILCCON 0269]|uniref:Uncharacterized protein n=1 Tax=Candidatus Clostridium eludens TaxID=3381663 RepID=A0ABW8SM69_9CLOT
MINKKIEKDERTTFIENISYRFGYKFIGIAILFDVVYRSLRFHESSWDLLAIVMLSALPTIGYQYKQKILGKTWMKSAALTFILTFVASLILAFLLIFTGKK